MCVCASLHSLHCTVEMDGLITPSLARGHTHISCYRIFTRQNLIGTGFIHSFSMWKRNMTCEFSVPPKCIIHFVLYTINECVYKLPHKSWQTATLSGSRSDFYALIHSHNEKKKIPKNVFNVIFSAWMNNFGIWAIDKSALALMENERKIGEKNTHTHSSTQWFGKWVWILTDWIDKKRFGAASVNVNASVAAGDG